MWWVGSDDFDFGGDEWFSKSDSGKVIVLVRNITIQRIQQSSSKP